MSINLRLVDFSVKNDKEDTFKIQMFGLNEDGETYSIIVKDFNPFFYVKVGRNWNKSQLRRFIEFIEKELRIRELKRSYKMNNYEESIDEFIENKLERGFEAKSEAYFNTRKCKIIESKKLYGFDCGKKYKFIKLVFENMTVFNIVKNLWYNNPNSFKKKKLKPGGLLYKQNGKEVSLELYEAKLPALLRFFHIQDISPSGWVEIKRKKTIKRKQTLCKYEYETSYKYVYPLREKEAPVPYKICSFDIEASSSHGDFPVAKKSYRKMLGEIITYWNKNKSHISKLQHFGKKQLFKKLINAAFEYETVEGISKVYTKRPINQIKLNHILDNLLSTNEKGDPVYPLGRLLKKNEKATEKEKRMDDEDNEEETTARKKKWHPVPIGSQIIFKKDILFCLNHKFDAGDKLAILDRAFDHHPDKLIPGMLPELEGDKCTFIGSTFFKSGENMPYFNHCVVLNTCEDTKDVPNSVIESYDTERDLLIGWRNIIQKEDPDIIIGYNIFGFDYPFLYTRAEENKCLDEFLKINRNKNVKSRLVEKQIRIASGTHELNYINMEGRIQVDLYNHFRREVNLPSYKLDYVASHFIGDYVKDVKHEEDGTKLKSYNLTGLQKYNYVSFELIGHSSDSYKLNGKKKFKVINMNEDEGWFKVAEELVFEEGKKIRWGLAKDDVTPQDIFRLTNGDAKDRAVIAKYCFQDCNLVQHIFRKNDIWTGFIEIANVCSVPIDYIVMRGQGIKLLSFLAKECRSKNTLMPVLEKAENDGSYEGAIVFPPKCGLYLDNPVAVVDYSSLYPSSMISENISHDSKVWTKEYDLQGRLIKETGNAEYDNLPDYKYVDVTYDTYEWKRESEKKKEVKMKVGYKVCRFAQFPNGKKAILPEILTDLLAARKATRKKAKYKTVKDRYATYIGLLKKTDTHHIITTEKYGIQEVHNDDVLSVEDTYDDYMKNVFNQRQLGIKVTANSMYGQTGARTSAFYEKDIAASTTATGRKLLIYGKKIIMGVYGDRICETKHGKVRTRADVVYGDTDSCFMSFNLEDLDGNKIRGQRALEMTIELAIEAGKIATKFLKSPHDLEYEKTFMPFCLLSKKRYVGMLYEIDPHKCKRKSMGIVLKRRDNAPLVKDVYGGIIDILMNEKSIEKAVSFTKTFLENIVNEKFPLEKLIISKSLREFYKNPDSIAHKVLADRIGKRDPGNKPSVGSRVPYVYIQTKGKVTLQGDKIESPDYIKKNNLKPDYTFYITNQIMKPVQQVFGLVLKQINGFNKLESKYKRDMLIVNQKYGKDDKKLQNKTQDTINKYVKALIFESSLRKAKNMKNNQRSIKNFFGK